jgi:hypothetical protein
MGWERRGKGGKRLVYIRKKRVGKRVTSIYCGSGERGRAAEREDLERREAAKRPAVAPEVLQGVTPEAADVAPAQVLEESQESRREQEARWVRILSRPKSQRKYRSVDSYRR